MRPMLALAAAVLLAAGCSHPGSGTLGPAPTLAPVEPHATAAAGSAPTGSSATPSGSVAPSRMDVPPTGAASPTGTITIQLWFVRADRLAATRRTRPATLATSRLALTELAAGPSAAERGAGLVTALPPGLAFTIDGIRDGVATVGFPAAFWSGPTGAARLRQAQVVYSLTQFPTVDRVRFTSGGNPVGPPVGRTQYAALLAPIVVLDPGIGQQVTSPITITGTADVFEATVSVRILDGAGRQLATTFTTATCGSGCRGDFRITVPYRSAGGGGTVEVYQVSPKDGSRSDLVAVPVRLAASP